MKKKTQRTRMQNMEHGATWPNFIHKNYNTINVHKIKAPHF